MIADLISGIARKLNLDEATARTVRVAEVQGGKISRDLLEDFNVAGVTEFTALHAEKVPDEELNATDDDRVIDCYHFDREPSKPHGVPFRFVVKPGEKFFDTRERLSKRTGVKGKLLQQIKFAVVPRGTYSKPRYLEDEDILADFISGEGDESLGLDHVNKPRNFWGKAEGMFIN